MDFRIPLSLNAVVYVEPVIPAVDVADFETDLSIEE